MLTEEVCLQACLRVCVCACVCVCVCVCVSYKTRVIELHIETFDGLPENNTLLFITDSQFVKLFTMFQLGL